MKLNLLCAAAFAFVCTMIPGQAKADNPVEFAYQGRVKVQGVAFNGIGQFKFAIINTSGNTTLWSNDGTSAGGGQPTAFNSLPVSDGVFNVLVGDPTTTGGMLTINPTVFNTQTPNKLRVWFNDGTHGFQQLQPDNNLVNLTLTVLNSGDTDFTIYVNGTTGDDNNNGLSALAPKKTIQSAVSSIPQHISCNITVSIASGVYRETVKPFGLATIPGKAITIQGDTSWTPALGGSPNVRITGKDNDAGAIIRDDAIRADNCSTILFKGLSVDYCNSHGFFCTKGSYNFLNCKATFCTSVGILLSQNTYSTLENCVADKNQGYGFDFTSQSSASMTSCSATQNGWGLGVITSSGVNLYTAADFNSNTNAQINCIYNSYVFPFPPIACKVRNSNASAAYGVICAWNSFIDGSSNVTYSGNLNSPNLNTFNGGSGY